MSYRNDQWHNLVGATGELASSPYSDHLHNDAGYYIAEADNDKFVYPTRRVRTLGTGTGTGLFGNAQVSQTKSTTLKRGYIRSLLTDGGTSRKCQFQFNPASINQSVSQNSSILNFLQSDPAQYVQPIPGNVTFQFSTFFDRTMEVVNGSDDDTRLRADNPWETASPGTVGVLHDLASLFSIIGVGVSDYMSNKLARSAGTEDNAAAFFNQETIRAFTSESDDLTSDEFLESFNDLVSVNKGNSAFLLPLPVRIVFSSLYIVEGMVKDIDVLYQKFSTNMVPIQARVDITLEAKYIGFAKKDTFFTNALSKLSDYADQQDALRRGATYGSIDPDYVDAMNSDFGEIQLYVVSSNTVEGSGYFDGITKNVIDSDHYNFNRMVSAPSPGDTVIDDSYARDEASDRQSAALNTRHIRLEFPKLNNNRIANLIAGGTAVDIEVSAQVHCYRFMHDESIAYIDRQLSQAGANLSSDSVSTDNGTLSVPRYRFSSVAEAKNLLDNAVSSLGSGVAPPEKITINDDPQRVYKASGKMWSVELDSNNLLNLDNVGGFLGIGGSNWDGVNSITTVEDIAKFIDHRVNSDNGTSSFDERSAGYVTGTDQKVFHSYERDHPWAYYIIYAVIVNATIGTSSAQKINVQVSKYSNLNDVETSVPSHPSASKLFPVSHRATFQWITPNSSSGSGSSSDDDAQITDLDPADFTFTKNNPAARNAQGTIGSWANIRDQNVIDFLNAGAP